MGDENIRIAIIDADLNAGGKHRFPNLVCMKLSAFYKNRNDDVVLKTEYDKLDEFDQVFISKVFTDTKVPDSVLKLPNVQWGGTGFYYPEDAPPLPNEIEHMMPDYHLYDTWANAIIAKSNKPEKERKNLTYFFDYSIGFTTRGCIRHCKFCVNRTSNASVRHSHPSEFIDESRKYICLLDDNVFACKDWKEIFESFKPYKKPIQYKQGMDERLLNDEKCQVLFSTKWIGDYIFAFDNINDRDLIERKLQCLRKWTKRIPKFYVFCAYNHEIDGDYSGDFWVNDIRDVMERIKILMKYQCLPYIMRYADYTRSPFKGIYITIQRWCAQPQFFKKYSLEEFVLKHDANHSCRRYLAEFKKWHPYIYDKYFHMKWGEV